uniref:Structural maintenance of chromosomes protein 6 n=1 Tax=Astyanax mexicanus TaxID=7994 RepID=A0A3B1JUU8_ASTMX
MSKRKSSQTSEGPRKRVRPSNSRIIRKRGRRNMFHSGQPRRQWEVGIIEKIFLKNFMCHSLLGPFTFGSNVNFVVGNNGSGKSAILTALIVGLGGKAQTTNRGSSLKGFVKEGESSAEISITLRNRESITIDLRISSEGLRTYKLKSNTGYLVSSKKEELVSILDHFSIQVDNPVSVLTQEMSKHFLHSKGEGDKYRFFMKATQLEQMKEDYNYIMETKTVTQNTVEKHEEILQDLRRKYKQKEEKYKNLASIDDMQEKLEKLKHQMAWALVRSAAFHRQKTAVRDLERDKEQLLIYGFSLSLSITQSSAADSQARVQQMDHLQSELDALIFQETTLAQQIDQFQQACTSSKDNLSRMRREEQDLQRAVDSKQRDLSALEGSRHGGLRRFGEQMPAFLAAIDEAHRKGQFRKKPVGPLGFCIRLQDADYALAVESCLKALMLAFCCDNYADERVLQALMIRSFPQGRRPQIIVSEFIETPYNISNRAVNHPEFPTVLQALDIDNPVVANCLIDMRGIETVLLIKNSKDARRVMQGGNPPRNCREAFTREGDQVYSNRYYSSDQQRAHYLSRDVEQEIRYHFSYLITHELHQRIVIWHSMDRCRKLRLEINDLRNVEEPQSEDLKPLVTFYTISTYYNTMSVVMSLLLYMILFYSSVFLFVCLGAAVVCVQEELSKSDQEVEKSKHHKKHYEEKRKTHIAQIQTQRNALEEKEQQLQASTEKACEISPERIDIRRTAKSLDTEINHLKRKIITQQEQHGDRDTIIREYQESLESYNITAQQVKCLKHFTHLLGKIMDTRHDVYTEMRRYLSVRCKYYFDSMLSQRGYTGSMTFNHKTEALSISVQPGEGDKAALSDMRSLSGGERSFSTVCFVLSLWAIAEAPFRCLDEFDVYMDMVNRRISMDMMLKIAASQRYRQFIFLTPPRA